MLFLRRKLIIKLFLIELIFMGTALALWVILPPETRWVIVASLAVANLIAFINIVTLPLNKILKEVKALLTGKQYNRIYTKKLDEVGIIANFFNEVTRSLERISTDIKDHRRIASELNIAQKIQRDLLPQSSPDIAGLDIIAKTKPAAEIGGDSFDFITVGEQTYMYVGDVTGHGVPSGLVMMIVDTLIHAFVDKVQNSKELLHEVNTYLKPRIQSTMFMTMVMLRFEQSTQKLFFTGAGHETIIHYQKKSETCNNIKGGGIALGMIPDNNKLIKEQEIIWDEGDYIILYSDGIVEARNMEGEMYGTERLLKVIEKWTPKCESAEQLFQRLSAEITLFLGEHIQADDMTLLVIRKGNKLETKQGSTDWGNTESKSTLVNYGGLNAE